MTLNDLDPKRLQVTLETRQYGRRMELLRSIDSTNEAMRRALKGEVETGHVILADSQDAGRGQHGRSWFSPAGSSLYFSILDRPRLPGTLLPMITLAVGLAVAETVDAYLPTGCSSRIKWPNDVRVMERKMAGILVEAVGSKANRAVIIGIGLNVLRRSWPEELQTQAAAMAELAIAPVERGKVLVELLGRVESRVRSLEEGAAASIVSELQDRLEWKGEVVQCGPVRGKLLGLSSSGALRLATFDGVREVISGSPRLAGRAGVR